MGIELAPRAITQIELIKQITDRLQSPSWLPEKELALFASVIGGRDDDILALAQGQAQAHLPQVDVLSRLCKALQIKTRRDANISYF